MECSSCRSPNPEAASFCFRCGTALRSGTGKYGRSSAYAVQSAENVVSFSLISTIMPHTSRKVADSYRWAMLATGILVLGFTLAGILPAAVLAGAFLVPLAYLVYIYDVNLWEDAPAAVVGGVFVLTGILSTLVSLVFFRWVFAGQFQALVTGSIDRGHGTGGGFPIGPLVIFAVLLPVVAEIVKNVGPVFLAAKPKFDDMVDGLTFGVAAGTAYAAFESLVQFAPVFTSGQLRTTDGLANWLVVVLNLMVVKSLIYGTATGLAVASFSGLGQGYDGFKPRYYKSLAFAMLMNVLYWLGVQLFARAPFGSALGLLWGLVILAALIVRVRIVLHTALLEAAVEDATRGDTGARAVEGGFCTECEMPLLPGALFCIVCGTSVRAAAPRARRERTAGGAGGAA